MTDQEKTTARKGSVGAEPEQSLSNKHRNSITDIHNQYNDSFAYGRETGSNWAPPAQFYVQSRHLDTITMTDLYDKVFPHKPPLIEGMLYPGTYLFAGAPKLGKSFLMMQIAYHAATGIPLWKYPIRKGTVLYLALEDDQKRLQDRLYRMFGTDCAENLHLATKADTLDRTLMDQLRSFYREHPDLELIIIDTLQKIREISGESYSYSHDYVVITRLKEFTDATGICLLLVHHTRKQPASDKFEMISGTNGLMGAADGAFLLHKDKRVSGEAVLEISGRDQPDQTLYLNRNEETLGWDLSRAEVETFKPKPDPVIVAVAGLITKDNPVWSGTATALVEALGIKMSPNTLTMNLNIHASCLLNDHGISYKNERTHAGRRVSLALETEKA